MAPQIAVVNGAGSQGPTENAASRLMAARQIEAFHQPLRIRDVGIAVAAATLAFTPLIAAFAVKTEVNLGSFTLIDSSVKGTRRAHVSEITAITINENSLATSAHDGTVKFWDIKSGRLIRSKTLPPATPKDDELNFELNGTRRSSPLAIAFGADGKLVAMTDQGPAAEDSTGSLKLVSTDKYDARISAKQLLIGSAIDVAKANQENRAIARNWLPHRSGIAPFVALAVPGHAFSYAVGLPDGTVEVESVPPNKTGLVSTPVPAGSPRHDGPVSALAASPDGKLLASVSDDGSEILWKLDGHGITASKALSSTTVFKDATVLSGHTAAVLMVTFSLDGKRIATASADKTARIWDAETGSVVGSLMGHEDAVLGVAFNPDDTRLATASADKTVRLWDLSTRRLVSTLHGHTDTVRGVAFSPDGGRIATASDDKTARIWEATSGKAVIILHGHSAAVNSVAFSPDGSRVVTASSDSTARIWDATSGKQITTLRGHSAEVSSAAFSSDGTKIVTASRDNTARIWDTATGTLLRILIGDGALGSAFFNSDNGIIVTASADKTARIWDSHTGSLIAIFRGSAAPIYSAAFNPDSTKVATASADGTVRLWLTGDVQSNVLASRCTPCTTVAFSRDSQRLITGGSSGYFQIWNTHTGELVRTMHQDASINVALLNPSGRVAITAGDDGAARLWDVNDGALIAVIRGHNDSIVQAELTPDDTRLVTAGRDGSVRVTSLAQAEWLNNIDPVRLYRQFGVHAAAATSRLLVHLTSYFGSWVGTSPPTAQALAPEEILASLVRASHDKPFNLGSPSFDRALHRPLDLQTLNLFIHQGYSRELLFWLFTELFQVNKGGYLYGYHYDPPDDYGCSREDPLHRCFIDWIHSATLSGLTVEERTMQSSSSGGGGGGTDKSGSAGKPTTTAYARFCLDRILGQQAASTLPRELVVSQTSLRNLDVPIQLLYEKELICRESWDQDQFSGPQPDTLPLKFGDISLTIVLRSVYGVFGFLGSLMKVEREQIPAAPYAYIPPDRQYALQPPRLETVHEDPRLLTIEQNFGGQCFTRTLAEDGDYCVPEDAATTKRIFQILTHLIPVVTN